MASDTNTVVRGESKQEFEAVLKTLLSEATLGTAQEMLLIKIQAQSYWKLQRSQSMEAGALSASLAAGEIKETIPRDLKDGNLGGALALALREQAAWFETLRRYSASAEKTYFRVTRELAMIRKAGPQKQIGYVPQNETTAPSPEIEVGCDSQPAAAAPRASHPAAQPRPELGGLSQFAFIEKLENMSEAEAMTFFDELSFPRGAARPEPARR